MICILFQGHKDYDGSPYTKNTHSVTCSNVQGADAKTMKKLKPEPPYYWDIQNVTCRDWKIRYCCGNMWGEPALYGLVASKAEETVPKYTSRTDVFVDKPTRKTLFEDCEWGNFVRYHLRNFFKRC